MTAARVEHHYMVVTVALPEVTMVLFPAAAAVETTTVIRVMVLTANVLSQYFRRRL
jgi:hypothetical protein